MVGPQLTGAIAKLRDGATRASEASKASMPRIATLCSRWAEAPKRDRDTGQKKKEKRKHLALRCDVVTVADAMHYASTRRSERLTRVLLGA